MGALIVVVAVVAAVILPIYLFCRFVQYAYLAYKLRRKHRQPESGWWLTDAEKDEFKSAHLIDQDQLSINLNEHRMLSEQIAAEHQKASNAQLAINNDGSYSRRSDFGKGIQNKINELNALLRELDIGERETWCRQPVEFFDDYNDLLKKRDVALFGLLGWVAGALIFISSYFHGSQFGLWLDLFLPALCAGIAAGLAKLLCRYPARRLMPKPVWITLQNVDRPQIQFKKSGVTSRIAVTFFWICLMVIAFEMGRVLGTDSRYQSEIHARNQRFIEEEKMRRESYLASQNRDDKISRIQDPHESDNDQRPIDDNGITKNGDEKFRSDISYEVISHMNQDEVEEFILAIYAFHGATFESSVAQKWANKQSRYRMNTGKDIHDAEKDFTSTDRKNIKQLIARWYVIQEEEGLPAVPIEASPLAGRAVSEDIDHVETEEDEVLSPATSVLKALPIDPLRAEEVAEPPKGNLNPEEISQWNAARVRYEINTIYARHGVMFPKPEIQAYFDTKDWYQPVAGLSFADAENKFSEAERRDIEMLGARRKVIMESE